MIKDLSLEISLDGLIIMIFITAGSFLRLITHYVILFFAHLDGFIIGNSAYYNCHFYLFGLTTIQIESCNKLLLEVLLDLILKITIQHRHRLN